MNARAPPTAPRQPGVGGAARYLVGGLVEEPPRVLLRGDRAAVEPDRVPCAGLGFSVQLDAHWCALDQRFGLALQRDDSVGVVVPGLGRVVGPLESLERMRAAGGSPARSEPGIGRLEGLHAAQPESLALGVIMALDGEAQAALAPGRRQIEAEQHDVRAGDGVDRQAGLRELRSHRGPPSVVRRGGAAACHYYRTVSGRNARVMSRPHGPCLRMVRLGWAEARRLREPALAGPGPPARPAAGSGGLSRPSDFEAVYPVLEYTGQTR